MDRPTVYIETSVVSYLAARPSRDPVTARNQQLTRDWWNTRRHLYELVTSDSVLEEAARGEPAMARQRLALLGPLRVLARRPDVALLAVDIRNSLKLPGRAITDAFHIAFAAVYEASYLLTWDSTFIANPALWPRLERACRLRGFAEWEDPIVAEVHRTREQMLAEYGGDEGLFRAIKAAEAEALRAGTPLVSLPPRRPEGYEPVSGCEAPPGWEDPIVAEVHRIRREIMAEFDDDLHAYFRYIQALEEEGRNRGVEYVSLPPRRPEGYKPEAA